MPGQRVAGDHAAVGEEDGERPDRQPRVALGEDAGDPEQPRSHLPDERVDEVPVQAVAAEGGDGKERAADLDRQVSDDEEAGTVVAEIEPLEWAPKAEETDVAISSVANIRPSSISCTGRRSTSSQFDVHTVMNQAYITARVRTSVSTHAAQADVADQVVPTSWLTVKT